MSRVRTRPNATISNDFDINGAFGAAAALDDDSDDSSISIPQGTGGERRSCRLGFVAPVIPGGAVVKQDQIRLRVAKAGSGSPPLRLTSVRAYPDGSTEVGERTNFDVSWISPTTAVVLVANNAEAHSDLELVIEAQTFDVNTLDVGLIYEAYWDTIYVDRPVLDSVTVTPSSPINNTDQPLIAWFEPPPSPGSDPDAGSQTKFQVRVFTAAQYGVGGFSPGTSDATQVSGTTESADMSWQLPAPLDDATYRAYVRSARTVNGVDLWSDWEFVQFVIDVDRPAVPTINSITPNNTFARIAIVPGIGAGGAVSTDSFRIQRSLDGGTTWANIRTLTGLGEIVPGQTAQDYEVPNGVEALYRVRAIHSFGSGFRSLSDWVTAGDGEAWSSDSQRLKHPTDPSLNAVVRLFDYPELTRPDRGAVHQPLGAQYPIVVKDTYRGSPRGDVVFRVDTQAELDALNTLLDTQQPLLLQLPPDTGWPDRWLTFADDGEVKVISKLSDSPTTKTVAGTEVDTPSGALVSWI